ncbi:ABC transporter substrate-binding protein [Fictibacillus phosphorivorans]|uniref:ABC transporter substrate-binding protein n=1 Tax=Fictibacillus phosphorivorans TaxID=1221500 RepID=UPI00203A4DE1|nr:ABC transporter substrate-binding protein [Fictibacillus phosphorivorans]MCM3720053.1 ABC transporter substrate-binding protein [Fictibacillus phosphorivorans]MCM3777748.1 ABC transporter substrate-binding protein [Fictibacillus phosphorivorans]
MKQSKRRVGLLAFVFVLTFSMLLAGCSSDSSSSKGNGDQTTVTFWHPMTDVTGEAVEEVIKAFEKKNPDIKINAVYTANQGEGQNEKLLTAVSGGNPPDVAYFDRFEIGSWAAQGSLEDLSKLAEESGVTKDTYYPFAWEEASYEGKLYGMPTTTDSRLVYYNKDHFKEVGLDPENPPKDIAGLEEAAEKLTIKKGKKFKRIGFIPWYGQGWLYGWGWAFGGDFYDPETKTATANDPKVVESLEWIADFAKKYNVEDIAGFTDSQGSGAMDPFLSGQLSMKVSGPWEVSAIKKFKPDLNYGVFPMPTPTGENHTTWSGGWSVVMPKGAKNKEAAWEFMKFFSGEEGQKIFSGIARDFSVIDSVNEELGYKNDPILKEFVEILPNSHHRPVMTQGSLYWNELASAVENATRGNGTPKKLLDKVNDKVNKELKK